MTDAGVLLSACFLIPCLPSQMLKMVIQIYQQCSVLHSFSQLDSTEGEVILKGFTILGY